MLEKVKLLRKELHKYPELSNREFETKKRLIKFIKENTSIEVVDKGAWFYAKYESGTDNKKIAFRADMDALLITEEMNIEYNSVNKGISHKCGHDGHMASLIYFLLHIDKYGANRDIYCIFQHAEETGDGAKECMSIIDEEDIYEIYAVHNMPGKKEHAIGIVEGIVNYASSGMKIEFVGKKSHASEPEKGINPAYIISEFILGLKELEKNYENIVFSTVVNISMGDESYGISPSDGKVLLTIRADNDKDFDSYKIDIINYLKQLSKKYHIEYTYSYSDEFPSTINHKESVEKIRKICKKLDFEIDTKDLPLRTSEDFGWFLKKAKGALIWIGAGEDHVPLHYKDYDFNENLIETINKLYMELL